MSVQETSNEVFSALEALLPELQHGEKLVWIGRSTKPRIGFLGYMPAFFGMGPFLIAFAGFWFYKQWQVCNAQGWRINGGMIVFFLSGLIPLGIGLCMAAEPLRRKRRIRMSVYAITNQRVIVLQKTAVSFGLMTLSARREDLGHMHSVERSDGSGDLILQQAGGMIGTMFDGRAGDLTPVTVGFWGIERVREVEALLRRTLRLDEADEAHQETPASS